MGRLISIHPTTVYLMQDSGVDLITLATALPDDTAITLYRGVWNTDDTPPYRVTLGELRAWCAAGKPMPPDRDDLSHQRQAITPAPAPATLSDLVLPPIPRTCPDCGTLLTDEATDDQGRPTYCGWCDHEPREYDGTEPTRDEAGAALDRLREEKYRR